MELNLTNFIKKSNFIKTELSEKRAHIANVFQSTKDGQTRVLLINYNNNTVVTLPIKEAKKYGLSVDHLITNRTGATEALINYLTKNNIFHVLTNENIKQIVY